MKEMIDTTVLLYGLNIFSGSKSELLDMMYLGLKEEKSLLRVATPNPEQVVQAAQSDAFLSDLGNFDLLLPDGQGLVVASQLLAARGSSMPLKERITGREVVADLLAFAQENHMPVLVLGGREYNQKIIAQTLIRTNHPIKIALSTTAQENTSQDFTVSWLPGYQSIADVQAEEEALVVSEIKRLKPKIVFVAFGAPHQEAWINQHQKLLQDAGVVIAMAVGGSFDYLTGQVPQVPALVEKTKLEWLFRLITQPWRWRRQLRLITFIGLTLKLLLKKPTG